MRLGESKITTTEVDNVLCSASTLILFEIHSLFESLELIVYLIIYLDFLSFF